VWPRSLAHHHIAYRAQVRAKVTAIRAGQGDPDAPEQARHLLDLAASHLGAGRVRLILVGGPPGSGKSTLASGLAGELGGVLLRSDEVRKELAGLAAHAHAPAELGRGIYAEDATAATYGELLDRAAVALGMGETVLLDASWSSAAWRDRARALATRTMSDVVELRCDAPAQVAAERIRHRARVGLDPSDATPEIAASLAATAAPWPQALTVDTTGTPGEVLDWTLSRVRPAPPQPR
jgi:predicted kinase